MRRSLAILCDCNGFARTLIGALAICFAAGTALCASLQPDAPSAKTSDQPACDSDEIVVYESNQSSAGELPCGADARTSTETAEARAYLVETAKPGYTMTRQGPELAIERLHPEFAVRLANAVREAREAGLPFAGIFSAYRPPAFGVGGFTDKFNSLHAYGLAVDVHGIGRPGSLEALIFHEIAAKHGVVCPYGPHNRAEWNHCQPTRLKIVLTENPLRDTITAQGPLSLETMFEVGNSVIDSSESAADASAKDMPAPQFAMETTSVKRIKPKLARFKVKSKPVDGQATASSQRDEKDSDAKPGNTRAKGAAKVRAAKVAAKSKNKSKGKGGRQDVAERRVAKKVSRLADKKMRARPQLVKPPAIMVEERRRPKAGRG